MTEQPGRDPTLGPRAATNGNAERDPPPLPAGPAPVGPAVTAAAAGARGLQLGHEHREGPGAPTLTSTGLRAVES